ncbi:hypothetical protein WJX84_008242 [Apatococcus fuscideae]|uniref:FHA domain-containing protein n=1 Tax=Apatococcus fuscideae TaxID=2026836 RepID=A0AAW1RZY6_9CHLO
MRPTAIQTPVPTLFRCRSCQPLRCLGRQHPVSQKSFWQLAASKSPADSAGARLTLSDGSVLAITEAKMLVGSSPDSDLRLSNPRVQEQHAELEMRGGSLYLTALHGDPEDIRSESFTWLNGAPLRPGVAYLLGTGAELDFGSQGDSCKIDFHQKAGDSSMMEMLMKNMASSEDVRRQLDQM